MCLERLSVLRTPAWFEEAKRDTTVLSISWGLWSHQLNSPCTKCWLIMEASSKRQTFFYICNPGCNYYNVVIIFAKIRENSEYEVDNYEGILEWIMAMQSDLLFMQRKACTLGWTHFTHKVWKCPFYNPFFNVLILRLVSDHFVRQTNWVVKPVK